MSAARSAGHSNPEADEIQARLAHYASSLDSGCIPSAVVRAAKVRVIDTLGGLIGGFFGEPCRIARQLAQRRADPHGATLLGTRVKTTVDMAAFTNATTARYAEVNDSYHGPGSSAGHASDTITPLLAVAEHVRSTGQDFIAAVVLAYETFLRISDQFHNEDFHNTNFASIAVAVGAARLLRLSEEQISHCVAIAAVSHLMLMQVRSGHLSMFKAAAPGQAGRAGVFAALLARSGMQGPALPFSGRSGWCEHVAHTRFSFPPFGGDNAPYKLPETQLKTRAANGSAIPSIVAAEKLAPLKASAVKEVTVEVYKLARDHGGMNEHHLNPQSREAADHSIPYVVAATLLEGTVNLRSFDERHLRNPELRALMRKITVVENPEFTRAYGRLPIEHRSRVTVVTADARTLIGDAGGDAEDMTMPRSDAQITDKFKELTADLLSTRQIDVILKRLWRLDEEQSMAAIPGAFVFN